MSSLEIQGSSSNSSIGTRGLVDRQGLYLAYSVYIAIAVALAYPLISLGIWMFSKDYYEHWPMLVIGACGLAAYRYKKTRLSLSPRWSIRVLLWTGLAVALTASVYVLPSRWMASLAAIAVLNAVINFSGGRKFAALMFGPMLLLVAAIPLPVGFDNWFVVALQNLATKLASYWLDLAGVQHFTTGVSIQTAGQSYYVKDACSGIHSVFAAVAVGAGYGVYRGYGIRGFVAFLAQILFWVIVANALRVFLTVYGQTRLGIDLLGPTRHEMIGMVTFTGGVLLAISGDSFIRYLIPGSGGEHASTPASGRVKERKLLDAAVAPKVFGGLVAVFGLSGILVGGLFFRYVNPDSKPLTLKELEKLTYVNLSSVDEGFLPEVLGQWQRVGFKTENREIDSLFGGMISHVWRYRHASGRSVNVSLDGPYNAWHDLGICYRGVGWRVLDMQTIDHKIDDAKQLFSAELTLARDPIDSAQVLFGCFDGLGNDIKPPNYYGDAFKGLAHRFGLGTQDQKDFPGGMIQVQVFDELPAKISAQQLDENRELFWAIVENCLSQGNAIDERGL